jgi:hypothetical protein
VQIRRLHEVFFSTIDKPKLLSQVKLRLPAHAYSSIQTSIDYMLSIPPVSMLS